MISDLLLFCLGLFFGSGLTGLFYYLYNFHLEKNGRKSIRNFELENIIFIVFFIGGFGILGCLFLDVAQRFGFL
jgi:hypothetical protein